MLRLIFQAKSVRITIIFLIFSIVFISYAIVHIKNDAENLHEARSLRESGVNIQHDLEFQLFNYKKDHAYIINKLLNVRPKLDQIISFLNAIEEINKEVRLKTTIKSLEKNILDEPPIISDYIKYQITFTTTLKQTVNYIDKLEKDLPYYFKIDNLFVQQDLENLSPELYKVILNIKLYVKNHNV